MIKKMKKIDFGGKGQGKIDRSKNNIILDDFNCCVRIIDEKDYPLGKHCKELVNNIGKSVIET